MSRRQYSDGDPGPSQPKRLRASDTDNASGRLPSTASQVPFVPPQTTIRLPNDDYTIAWICALPLELRASLSMFDELHLTPPTQPGDSNTYALGRVERHNVVMACLPGEYGTNNAAIVATNLHRSFHKIRATLMVGIGGGAPSNVHDIRLGDIVVGDFVVQYDMGKDVEEGKFQRTGRSMYPPKLLSSVIAHLRAAHTNDVWSPRVSELLQTKFPSHIRPSRLDQLFESSYPHPRNTPTCDGCDLNRLEKSRPVRSSNHPKIHYGGIASANTVMKNARTRDDIARELSICCFEMEAAGIMDKQCLPIRGICDYSDSHKNKAWQDYAAAAAAAYARGLLEVLQPEIAQPTPASKEAQVCRSERREQLLSSIHFDELNDRYHDVKRAHSETCEWLMAHPKYQSWLDPEKRQQTRGFLWIEGKAGAGKSTIMKFACSDFEQNQLGAAVAPFFFNARGGSLEQSVVGMYRSLLWRLLHALPDLQVVLDSPFDISPAQKDCPSIGVLQKLFRNAVMGLGQRAFVCFVDALDESDEGDVEEMIEFFNQLSEDTTRKGIRFLVCFSSRPYPRIAIPPEVRIVLGDEEGHQRDLAHFVKNRLKVASSSDLQGRILEKADGVFMWAVLVVGILNKESNNGALALKQKLTEIPPSLSDLFRSILVRDQHNVDRLLLSVLWVLCANRPLTPSEFRHAVWVGELDQGTVDAVLENTSIDVARNLVTSSSKGLAEVTTSDYPTVQFIHESVRDFLIKHNGLREMWPDFGVAWEACAHDKLKNCCDTYLSLEGVQSIIQRFQRDSNQAILDDVTDRYPFLEYAGQNVLLHANAAAIAIPQLDFLDRCFTPTKIQSLNHTETRKHRLYTSDAPLLYILAHQGCATLVRQQMERTPAAFTQEYFNHPLFAALKMGHHRSAAALLNLPSAICDDVDFEDDIDAAEDDAAYYSGRTLLTWAAEEGRLNLMKALIGGGVDVNEADGGTRTALQRALGMHYLDAAWLLIDNGAKDFNLKWVDKICEVDFFMDINEVARAHFFVSAEATRDSETETTLMRVADIGCCPAAQLLINQGADINATGPNGRTALISALARCRKDMAQFLIGKGADGLACGWYQGKTALMHASTAGFEDIAWHLINQGAIVNTPDALRRTALFYASKAVARVLIDNGADVNHLDKEGKTPLLYICSADKEAITRILLESGANANHRDNYGNTALFYASKAVVQLLVDNGARLNRLNRVGKTALMHASENGNEDVVRLLIANGADVHFCEPLQGTALHLASRSGCESLVRLLIGEDGANIDASNLGGRTALMEATEHSHLATAQILLTEGGADVNARDKNHYTALLWACRSGNKSMVQLLTENGADIEARDKLGQTALMFAAASVSWRSPSVTRVLIQKGAMVNARDNNGWTALMLACVVGNSGTTSLLLDEGGTDCNTPDDRGWTALMVASNAGRRSVVELLLAKNADRSVQDGSGRTALSLATSRRYLRVARLLEP